MKKRVITLFLALVMCLGLTVPAMAQSYASYYINGNAGNSVSVNSCPSNKTGNCSSYASAIAGKLWSVKKGTVMTTFSNPYNILRNLSVEEREITADHVRQFIQATPLGSRIRRCSSSNTTSNDYDMFPSGQHGHTMILVAKDDINGTFTLLEGGQGGYAGEPNKGITVLEKYGSARATRYTYEGFVYKSERSRDKYFYYISDYSAAARDKQNNTSDGATPFSFSANAATIADGTYTLTPACAPNARLDVAGGSRSNLANVQIYANNGTDAQKWDIASLGNGYYKLTAKCSGQVLDANYNFAASGENVAQYPWRGGNYQQWKFTDAGDGYYYIVPRCNESLCLDVYSASSSDGANVQVYTANQTSAQKWKLTPVDAAAGQVTTTVQTTTGQTTTRTEYRYGRYVYTDYRLHTCWCETYMKKLFGSAALQYSEWSTTRYSPTGKGWTCGNCRGNHIGVGHYTDGKAWWAEYSLPDGDYFWEESRTVTVVN